MPTTQTETIVAVHKILFATDFTEASRKAFKYTKAVARHFQASITTAHVLRASTQDWPRFDADPAYKKLWHETKQNLDSIHWQLHQAGFEADSVLLEGDPVEVILKAVKHHKADLLVLGTHGSRDLERLVLGSTAEEILRKAACPVLTVGPNVDDPSRKGMIFRRIVLATDLSPEASAAAVYAFALSSGQPSHISICHVLPEGHIKTLESTQLQADFMQKMTELIPKDVRRKSSVEYVVEYGNAADEILKLGREKHADLIVLGARAASMVVTHLVPGVVFRVIAGATCPVLTVCK
jgi:nucleotide-binding universal stress UspA family protein